MNPDIMNGCIEAVGSLFAVANVRRLLRDRKIQGVYWPATVFWTAWGVWNLYYYYPALGQWFSFWGGALLCSANLVWVALAWHYGRLGAKVA